MIAIRKETRMTYDIRHKNFITRARYNDSVAIFNLRGELVAVLTCDPDGVYWEGDIDYGYNYLGHGEYQVLFYDNDIIIKPVLYAYKTRHGNKFVVDISQDGNIPILVSMKIGDRIKDIVSNKPYRLGIPSIDGNAKSSDIDILVENIEIYQRLRYLHLADVYGVKNKDIALKIYKRAINNKRYEKPYDYFFMNVKWIYPYVCGTYGLVYGKDRQGNQAYHIVRITSIYTLKSVVWTGYDIEEAVEVYKNIAILNGSVSFATDKIELLIKDDKGDLLDLFAVSYRDYTYLYYVDDKGLHDVKIPHDRELLTLESLSWNEKDKEIVKEHLGIEEKVS